MLQFRAGLARGRPRQAQVCPVRVRTHTRQQPVSLARKHALSMRAGTGINARKCTCEPLGPRQTRTCTSLGTQTRKLLGTPICKPVSVTCASRNAAFTLTVVTLAGAEARKAGRQAGTRANTGASVVVRADRHRDGASSYVCPYMCVLICVLICVSLYVCPHMFVLMCVSLYVPPYMCLD